jgi:hypothetical protein
MALAEISQENDSVRLLQRSLERGRLGHAYLFNGLELAALERVARTLAKALVCEQPPKGLADGPADGLLRPMPVVPKGGRGQSSRRDLGAARIEVTRGDDRPDAGPDADDPPEADASAVQGGVIVSAERLNVQAANAFLKTLEEPPADSVLILLTTEPQRILETILSRCLRLNLAGGTEHHHTPEFVDWLRQFAAVAAGEQKEPAESVSAFVDRTEPAGSAQRAGKRDAEQAFATRTI